MEELTFGQLTCLMMGKRLVKAAELPDAQLAGELVQFSKDLRSAMITMSLRKRKSKKTEEEKAEAAAAKLEAARKLVQSADKSSSRKGR